MLIFKGVRVFGGHLLLFGEWKRFGGRMGF